MSGTGNMDVFLSLYQDNWIILCMWERTFSHHPSFPLTGVHIWERKAFPSSWSEMAVRSRLGPGSDRSWLAAPVTSEEPEESKQLTSSHGKSRCNARAGLEKQRFDPELGCGKGLGCGGRRWFSEEKKKMPLIQRPLWGRAGGGQSEFMLWEDIFSEIKGFPACGNKIQDDYLWLNIFGRVLSVR